MYILIFRPITRYWFRWRLRIGVVQKHHEFIRYCPAIMSCDSSKVPRIALWYVFFKSESKVIHRAVWGQLKVEFLNTLITIFFPSSSPIALRCLKPKPEASVMLTMPAICKKCRKSDWRIRLEWKLFLTTIAEHVSFVPKNLGFFLSDDHLTKHVAGTEEVVQGNLIRVPPNKRLPEETFFSPPWTENVNPSAFPIPEMIDLAAFCLSDISSDNNHLHNFQHTMSTYLAAWHESVCCTPPEPRTPTEIFWFNIDENWKFNFLAELCLKDVQFALLQVFVWLRSKKQVNLICASSKRLNTTCVLLRKYSGLHDLKLK